MPKIYVALAFVIWDFMWMESYVLCQCFLCNFLVIIFLFIHSFLLDRFLFSLQHLWTIDSSVWLWSDRDSHITLSILLYRLVLVLSSASCVAQVPRISYPSLGPAPRTLIFKWGILGIYLPAQRDHGCSL